MPAHKQTITPTMTIPSARLPARCEHDAHVEITLFGRYMRSCQNEFPCSLRKISVAGAEIISPYAVAAGELIIAYFDRLGGLEGEAVEVFDGGFAMTFSITQRRRQKLASQLAALSKQNDIQLTAMGRPTQEQRMKLAGRPIRVSFENGQSENCDALGASISSALLVSANRPPVGSLLTVGKLRARVMHHHDKGFGVAFIDLQKAAAVRRHFG